MEEGLVKSNFNFDKTYCTGLNIRFHTTGIKNRMMMTPIIVIKTRR